MLEYVIRRLVMLVPTVLGVSLLVFLAMHFMPTDPARMMLTEHRAGQVAVEVGGITEEMIEAQRIRMGLHRPLYAQFGSFVWNVVRGDLGESWRTGRRVSTMIMRNLPYTVELSLGGLLIGTFLGISFGVISALKHKTWFDTSAMFLSVVGVSMPSFWLALMLLLFIGMRIDWIPNFGSGTFAHVLLPATTLGLRGAAMIARITRSSMLEILGEDYVRTARAKGLSERVVVYKHSLKNALIPVVTLVGLSLGAVLSGTVILENVFGRPGLGRLAVDFLLERDFPVVQAVILLIAIAYVVANLVVDITYGYIDPRIRYG